MITITLRKIQDHNPCADGWRKVLAANGGTSADMNAEFPLSSILDSNDLDDTLWCLPCLPEHEKVWRLFAVWCARQVEHLMTDERSVAALGVAERHAAGKATDEELAAARAAAWAAARAAARDAARAVARDAARAAARAAAWAVARAAARDAAWAVAWANMLRQVLDSDDPLKAISDELNLMRNKA